MLACLPPAQNDIAQATTLWKKLNLVSVTPQTDNGPFIKTHLELAAG
jgi:hypothetical protein